MFKKLLTMGAVALLSAGMLSVTPAQAQMQAAGPNGSTVQLAAPFGPGYYFISICTSASKVDCPFGTSPIWFGVYADLATCIHARSLAGVFNTWPWSASSCFFSN